MQFVYFTLELKVKEIIFKKTAILWNFLFNSIKKKNTLLLCKEYSNELTTKNNISIKTHYI